MTLTLDNIIDLGKHKLTAVERLFYKRNLF